MRKLISRLAQVAAAVAVITLLAFGGFQVQATAASLDHCHTIPGPDIHCEDDIICQNGCPGAVSATCVPASGGPNCCQCIW